jgi:hypothetical protein
MDNTGTTCMATNMSNERSAHNQIVSFHDNGMSGAFMTAFIFGGVPVKNIGLDDKDAFDAYGNRITYVASDVLASYNRPSTGFIGSVLQGIKGFGKTKIRINNLNTGNRTELFSQFSSCGLDVYFGLFGASGTAHTGVNWQNSLVFTACNAGVYSVLNGQSVDGAINQLAYVVINHGANGFGAWNAAGQLNALSSDAFEKANSFAFYINPANNTATSNYSLTDSTKPLKFYYGQRTATFDDIVAWSTTKDLLINAGMSNGVYCHPTTHPKLTNATNADTGNNTTIIAKKYGENMADGSTSMICQGMGNWM